MLEVGNIKHVVAAWISNYYLSKKNLLLFSSAEHYISTLVANMF
jgi:hypothetical protein